MTVINIYTIIILHSIQKSNSGLGFSHVPFYFLLLFFILGAISNVLPFILISLRFYGYYLAFLLIN